MYQVIIPWSFPSYFAFYFTNSNSLLILFFLFIHTTWDDLTVWKSMWGWGTLGSELQRRKEDPVVQYEGKGDREVGQKGKECMESWEGVAQVQRGIIILKTYCPHHHRQYSLVGNKDRKVGIEWARRRCWNRKNWRLVLWSSLRGTGSSKTSELYSTQTDKLYLPICIDLVTIRIFKRSLCTLWGSVAN